MEGEQKNQWIWLINPKGRPVEVLVEKASLLLKQGYSKADLKEIAKSNIDKEFLEIIRL